MRGEDRNVTTLIDSLRQIAAARGVHWAITTEKIFSNCRTGRRLIEDEECGVLEEGLGLRPGTIRIADRNIKWNGLAKDLSDDSARPLPWNHEAPPDEDSTLHLAVGEITGLANILVETLTALANVLSINSAARTGKSTIFALLAKATLVAKLLGETEAFRYIRQHAARPIPSKEEVLDFIKFAGALPESILSLEDNYDASIGGRRSDGSSMRRPCQKIADGARTLVADITSKTKLLRGALRIPAGDQPSDTHAVREN